MPFCGLELISGGLGVCIHSSTACGCTCVFCVFTCLYASEREGQLLAAQTETQSQTDSLENPELELPTYFYSLVSEPRM